MYEFRLAVGWLGVLLRCVFFAVGQNQIKSTLFKKWQYRYVERRRVSPSEKCVQSTNKMVLVKHPSRHCPHVGYESILN